MKMESVLEIENLKIAFDDTVLHDVSFTLAKGEMLALVGESGSGKTILCRAVFELLGRDAMVMGGKIKTPSGCSMSMVLQDPLSSLDPAMTIGAQIAEAMHGGSFSARERKARAEELLAIVGIPRPKKAVREFPSHFSGGMRQRVAIAIALAMEPDILFADEPTTSLDAGLADAIMEIFRNIKDRFGTSILFITHDLGLVRANADRVLIIESGRIIEEGAPEEIFQAPKEEYTKRLIRYAKYADGSEHTHGKIHFHSGKPHSHKHETKISHAHESEVSHTSATIAHTHESEIPHAHEPEVSHTHATIESNISYTQEPPDSLPIVVCHELSKNYKTNRGRIKNIFRDISFEVMQGETLGLCGRSGIGKSTLARMICRMEQPSSGSIEYGAQITKHSDVQMIFQDSRSALNPRMKIREIIAEPLRIQTGTAPDTKTIEKLMERVELQYALLNRYPHEISGGERQRTAIARAISTSPKLIIADEPISSLDVTVRNKIVHLLQQLKTEDNLTLILISHDQPLLMHVSDRIITLSKTV